MNVKYNAVCYLFLNNAFIYRTNIYESQGGCLHDRNRLLVIARNAGNVENRRCNCTVEDYKIKCQNKHASLMKGTIGNFKRYSGYLGS